MDAYQFTYRPRKEAISYLHVCRPAGHRGHKIHMHDHHELVLVSSASTCRMISNGNSLTVQTPAVFVNRAGSFHEVVAVEEGFYDSQVVYFHPKLLSGLPESMVFRGQLLSDDLTVFPLTEQGLQSLLPLFELLRERPADQQLPLLLCAFASLTHEGGPQPLRLRMDGSYIFEVVSLLQNEEGEHHTLTSLSKRFHVSPTKLKNDFKRITGTPVNTFSVQSRLQKARILLETGDASQAWIAQICGFADESHFIRTFRKQYGITPGAFRKKS